MKVVKTVVSLVRCAWLKMRFGSLLQLQGLPRIGRTGFFSVRDGGRMELGRATIGDNVTISAPGGRMRVGDGVSFNVNCYVVCRGEMTIGDGCAVGPGVCIVDHNHNFDENGLGSGLKVGKIVIGKKCWIGANAVILKDTIIGDGCVIGAGAVVKGNIPAHSLVVSNRELVVTPIRKRS